MPNRKIFTGTTEGGSSRILGSPFWEKGTTIRGIFSRNWRSRVGDCYEFLAVPGEKKPTAYIDEGGRIAEKGSEITLDKFSIGALTGFEIAIADLKTQGYVPQFRDVWEITCTGFQASGDKTQDDMVMFSIKVE